jgi:hypothetical protein
MTIVWIAEQSVIFVHSNGHRSLGRIAVGLPIQVDSVEARCLAVLDGIDRRPIGISGSSTLQALLLAVRFLGMRLHDFLSKGGHVLDPEDDSDTALDGLFGPMLGQFSAERANTPSARRTRRRSSRKPPRGG